MNANLLCGIERKKNTHFKIVMCLFACCTCTAEIIIHGINAIDTFKSSINNIVITMYLT